MTSSTMLITGASGHLGQSVLSHLLGSLNVPAHRVMAATRSPARLAAWAARGVGVRVADFDDERSLTCAFRGADRVLLISTDIDRPGHRLQQHERAIAAAERAGVSHLIYTSMPEPRRSLVLFAPDHAETEMALAASTLANWTVLRNHWYFENLLRLLPGVLARGGAWPSAAGDGKLADIARDDLALAAAQVLATARPQKAIYTLSGAEALTTEQQVRHLSAAIGQPLRRVPVSSDELVKGLVSAGVPEPFARMLASFDDNTAAGHMGQVSDDFEKLVGRPPRTLVSWLASMQPQLPTRR